MNKITLNIGGQDREFYFGLGFLGNLLETENIQLHEINDLINKNPYKWMPLIMYHSLAWGFIRNNEPVLFNALDVADWIDSLTDFSEVSVFDEKTQKNISVRLQTEVITFFKYFWGSINNNVPIDKKKVTAKKK